MICSDNVRDNFKIGLFTGWEFLILTKLAPENISVDGFIEIETTKQVSFATILVHKYIKSILSKKRVFALKIRDIDFNEK
jgi:hypothetical protein